MAKSNGTIREIERTLGVIVLMPPRNHPTYQLTYQKILRKKNKYIKTNGLKRWVVAMKPWLKREKLINSKPLLGILTILAFDLLWLMQNMLKP